MILKGEWVMGLVKYILTILLLGFMSFYLVFASSYFLVGLTGNDAQFYRCGVHQPTRLEYYSGINALRKFGCFLGEKIE